MKAGPCELMVVAALVCALAAQAEPPLGAISRAAHQILGHQAADGAISLGAASDREMRVIPYFANFAALGLVAAYRETHHAAYLEDAKRWAAWYGAHEGKDGTVTDYTGRPEAWKSTGHYDSTDSYAGTYLELLEEIYKAKADLPWLHAQAPYIHGAIAAIYLTVQPNGLTTATPTYPVMYTMDNTETLRGLLAAVFLEEKSGEPHRAADARRHAERMQASIDADLWNQKEECYRVGIQTDGGKMEGLKLWYPDVMANLMAIAWLPPSERNRALFGRLKRQFGSGIPSAVRSEENLEHLVWWGYAARGAGDRTTSRRIAAALSGFDQHVKWFGNPALLGHACRLLAYRE